MTPLVSIVMATYNGHLYIHEQIESILNQTYRNIELIIIDDCSKDNTVDILNEYFLKDNRIKIYKFDINKGVVAAFEYGLSQAQGEYIALSDQDDIFDADKISLMVAEMEKNPHIDLVFSDLRLINQNGKLIAPSMWKYQKAKPINGKPFFYLLSSNFITGCATMIRKRMLHDAFPFPPDAVVHDRWLAVLATREHGGGIKYLNKQLVSYRQHHANVIGAKKRTLLNRLFNPLSYEEREKIYTKQYKRLVGYLLRDELWTTTDKMAIDRVINIYKGWLNDKSIPLFRRIMQLPERLKLQSDLKSTFGTIIYTIVPGIKK